MKQMNNTTRALHKEGCYHMKVSKTIRVLRILCSHLKRIRLLIFLHKEKLCSYMTKNYATNIAMKDLKG